MSLERLFQPELKLKILRNLLEAEGLWKESAPAKHLQNKTSDCHALISVILFFVFLAIFFLLLLLRLPLTMLPIRSLFLKLFGVFFFSHSLV